eukprot:COSAG06_NODE_17254_length_952_cov_2.200469_1_plen_272_part_10
MAAPRAQACFCLSKAREDGGSAGAAGANFQRLRSELEGLKRSELKRRAKSCGASAEDVEEACDAEDSCAAMIALIVAHEPASDIGGALRADLESMKISALEKRAAAAGATEEEIAEADDADDPTAAMVALVLSHEVPGTGTAALRAELETLKQGSLVRRAKEAGIDEVLVEEALDTEDPKAALIELILNQPEAFDEGGSDRHSREPRGIQDGATENLRAELAALKVSALRKRAASCASEEQLEEADDSDDLRSALLDIILENEGDIVLRAAL